MSTTKRDVRWHYADDVTSMKLRYEENNENDVIRLLELPKNTIIITPTMLEWFKKYSSKGVTLDDTFHTTRYNVKLANLTVADERDRGLPADDINTTKRDVEIVPTECPGKTVVTVINALVNFLNIMHHRLRVVYLKSNDSHCWHKKVIFGSGVARVDSE
ncbi:unnamed protein product [Heligmosomoides polygyrus]|uniref:Crinkler (CRN) family protein n=1 Tax=Heligmosomoides polygyrus TaxID=6339 RepID=A0A183GUZ2_HELPZ|nr:unnamed protein product [Heligmosomoides polygyrus]